MILRIKTIHRRTIEHPENPIMARLLERIGPIRRRPEGLRSEQLRRFICGRLRIHQSMGMNEIVGSSEFLTGLQTSRSQDRCSI